MNTIYTILERTTEKNLEITIIKFASQKHPIFQAHFPSNPLLPAFLLIDILAEIQGDSIQKIVKSKFISPILPHDTVRCECKKSHHQKKFKLYKNNIKISEIHYESH